MRVACKGNTGRHLPKKWLGVGTMYAETTEFYLKIGSHYNVYAIMLRRGDLYYGVCSYHEDKYFRWYPSDLFSLVDGKLSRSWIAACNQEISGDVFIMSVSYIASDMEFYDRLVNQDESARDKFAVYKEDVDLEFSTEVVEMRANKIDSDWLMCPQCDESWQSSQANELVRCPKCREILRRPLE